MAGSAAFFDLDRTILRRASGPILNRALVNAGIAPDRAVPGQEVIYRFYDLVGETIPAMVLARAAAIAAKGWSRSAVRKAGAEAAADLDEIVAPYARPLLDEHRRAGRALVLATTTPYDLIEPLAERLGFDAIVATRYAIADDETYTGGLEGEFVWARGKLAAVRRWAESRSIDMASSHAYSDSVYDLPLLNAVGGPHVVNPDPRLRLVAAIRRWPVTYLDAPPGVPKLLGLEPFDAVKLISRPELIPFARFDIAGLENIPARGPGIVVGNHRSYFDTVALGLTVVQSGRTVRFLGKAEVFDAPIVGQLARALGGIRVDRGSGSDEPLREATRCLEGGDLVVVMPQGTIPRGPQFFEPVLQGKTGAARLASATHAPVIPVGLWGTEHVWPRSSRAPKVFNVTNPPDVTVRVGRAVSLGYDDVHADTRTIMEAIVDELPAAARERRQPTAEELARTYPAGGGEGRATATQ